VMSFGAAVLTMIGMFQDLLTAQNTSGGQRFMYAITSWNARAETNGVSEPQPQGVPLNGVPLLVAVTALLAAAVLGMLAATRPPGRRWGRATGLTSVIAATFLAATVAAIGVQELWWLDIFQPQLDTPGAGSSVTVGPGYWTLVVGVALAVLAAVLAWRQNRPEPARTEPDTPRLGIPVVVRLPDEPPPPQ
jgi:hypothetical protein